ncbi:class I SAM-dependent methyltransferase [Candidatus Entotheonella palauensis]|uniref:class I SAM-dependent methyltransferase n=1 Tax=Candidatus Entotheonella palauensis TaxID=93172 RepID=UPI000B7C6AA2|nr:class I SAM-dependent methyltransferase [Candidatus Entotheonella palauensis]
MSSRFLTHEEAQAFYDRFGSKQDKQQWYEGPAVQDMVNHGEFEAAESVVELGCGTGAFAGELLQHHLPQTATYLGIDISSTMVELSRKRLEPFAGRAEIVLTDGARKIDLPDSSCDRFIANYVLDLLSPSDIRQVLDEAHRLLKPEGRLCVVNFTPGRTGVARIVTWVLDRVHRLHPSLLGGCRPLLLQDYRDQELWQVEYHHVVTAYEIPSEVMVASKRL